MPYGLELITTINEAVNPVALMQRITDRTFELIEDSQGVMIGLADETGVTYLTGAGNQIMLIGTHVELGTSLSGLAMQTGVTQRSDDTELDPRVDLEACRRHSVRSLICVPLRSGDESIGVMAVNCPVPNAFTEAHVRTLDRLADFVSVAISSARDLHAASTDLLEVALDDGTEHEKAGTHEAGAATRYVVGVLSPGSAQQMAATDRIEQVLEDPDLLSIVFQPVVDLLTERPIAVEALARFAPPPDRTPDLWFAEAHVCGLGVELELLAIRKAIDHLDELPPELSMTLNIGPEAAAAPGFAQMFDGVALDRIILELTEHAPVDDYPTLVASLLSMRRNGMRVAIDDTGAGYSSLAHILKIAPDFIKLDRELTAGIDIDPVRRALAASLVTFADDTGADIVAEGAETGDELAILRRLGVRYAQGFHLGRPAPLAACLEAYPQTPPA